MIGRHRAAHVDSLWELLGLGAPGGTAWMVDGLCAQADPEIFFPEKGQPTTAAKSVCAVCPVIGECRAYAVARGERFGVWGGLSERARRRLGRRPRAEWPVLGAVA